MPVKVTINSRSMNPILEGLQKGRSANVMKAINEASSDAALDAVQNYYERRGRTMWINPSLPTHGPGRMATRWADRMGPAWSVKSISSARLTMENPTIGLAHKVEGGTIRPKRVKWLTIPLVPQAHGRRAKEYAAQIAPLFRIKNCLAESDGNDGFRPVYALKKSVSHKPWPGALPAEDVYMDPFEEAAIDAYLTITKL